MGRGARSVGRIVTVAAAAAAMCVVAAPLAGAKPAPPSTTSPTALSHDDPAPETTHTPAPSTTASTAPATTVPTASTTVPPADESAPPSAKSVVIGVPPPVDPGEPPPPQPNPRITITPNTDLQDQQTVQIDATGYTPNTDVGAAQCQRGGTDVSDCDLSHSVITRSDADGNWSATMIVGARILVGGGVVDCRKADACGIGAARLFDYKEVATQSIAFDPDIEFPPAPVVTVDPAKGLVHDQQVAVTGTGFAPGDHVYVRECTDRDPYPVCDYGLVGPSELVADDAGTVSTSFTVKRFIGYPGQLVVDCADADCYLQLTSQTDQFATGRADLGFDPDARVERPTATAKPDHDLVHNQQIQLTGSGFSPFEDVQIAQCSVESDPYPVCSYGGFVRAVPVDEPIIGPIGPFVPPVDGDGNLSTTFAVRRLIGYPGPGGTVVDCAEKPGCVIRIFSYEDLLHSVDVPIAFDPDVPPPPPPTLDVRPNRDLVHDSVVTVTGRGFVPDDLVDFSECFEVEGVSRFCSYGGTEPVFADSDGSFTTAFTVKRVFGSTGEILFDCVEDGECALYARSISDPIATAEQELHFDPDAPLPDPPTMTVEPSTDLPWRGVVHVSGSGFAPNTEHNVLQCPRGSSPSGAFPCNFGPSVLTDAQGNLDADINVRRRIEGFPEPFECAPDNCLIAVYSYDDPLSAAKTPLNFDPSSSPPPRPTLTVTPYDDLAEGTTVTVEGAGFTPGAIVAVSQCRGGDTPALLCDGSILQGATPDANGQFSMQYSVHPGIVVPDGIIGCYDAPGACSIRAAAAGLPDEVTGPVPLTFGGKEPPGLGGGRSEKAPIAEDPPPTPTPVPTTPAPRLAFTGTPVAGYLEFGAIFLGLGTLLVLAGRRRRVHI